MKGIEDERKANLERVADIDLLQFKDLSLNRYNREVYRGQRSIELTVKEYDLLEYLMSYPRQILTRDRILDNVWGCDFLRESNIIEVHVRYLRMKLEQEGERRLIQTARGIGYTIAEYGTCG